MVCLQKLVGSGVVGPFKKGAGCDKGSDTPELHKCRGCERVVKLYTRHFVSLTVRK